MKSKLIAIITLFAVILLLACGRGKKLTAARNEIEQLKSQNTTLSQNVDNLNKQVSDLTAANKSAQDEYASYKANCEATREKYKAMSAYLQQQANTLAEVKQRIAAAESDFRDKGVDVTYKNGLVYVSMQDNLLYKSGSAALDDKGKMALAKLAPVLNDYPNLKVIVLGHTDDVKFKKGSDNWSLSTERANGVVRVLRDAYNVDPTRLTAAGKGKYDPIADNSTTQGRALNRRTDIILNPDMAKIWDSSNSNQ